MQSPTENSPRTARELKSTTSYHMISSSPTTNLPPLSPIQNWLIIELQSLLQTVNLTHGKRSFQRCFNRCVTVERATSLLTPSRDPSTLLRHPSVNSCCLATNEARRCDARQGETRRGDAIRDSSRHSRARLCSARRKHLFVYCCVIAGTYFEDTVLAWRKYTTITLTLTLTLGRSSTEQ
jgi:hypothetical protein